MARSRLINTPRPRLRPLRVGAGAAIDQANSRARARGKCKKAPHAALAAGLPSFCLGPGCLAALTALAVHPSRSLFAPASSSCSLGGCKISRVYHQFSTNLFGIVDIHDNFCKCTPGKYAGIRHLSLRHFLQLAL